MGIIKILIQENNAEVLYYGYSDYLGSLVALTNEAGNVVEHYAYDPWGARRNSTDWTQTDTRTTWIVNRGYTGHEHLFPFGGDGGGCIINMNGRVYDPLTASFFSPDPYLQAPDNWLNYNRYAYAYGNPFKYTDPDGEFIAVAVAGFIINGFISGMLSDMAGKSYWGGFLKGGIVGALSGVVGAGVGQAVQGALGLSVGTGFFNGAIVGAASGAAGGFVGGTFNSWMNGGNFGEGLMSGLKGAGMGGLTGGVIGGSISGINAASHGGNFWTGDGATYAFTASPNSSQGKEGPPVTYSNESVKEFSNKYFKSPKGLGSLYADGTVPEGYVANGDGFQPKPKLIQRIRGDKIPVADAVTRYNHATRSSDVYFSKNSFKSHFKLFYVMQHEYIHVSANYNGWFDNVAHERAAYGVTKRQLQQWGYGTKYIDDLLKWRYPLKSWTPVYNVNYGTTIRKIMPTW